jgi:hypothetical protein
MDNGLIFPYPRRSDPDEPRCANHLRYADLRASVSWLGTWRVVVKRWGDAGGQLNPAGGRAGVSV